MEVAKIVSVGIYNTDLAVRRGTLTRKRKTAMFEIEIPIECGGTSFIDGREAPITTDMIICAKPGQTRHTRLPFKCYYIHIIINEGMLYDHITKLPDFIKIDDSSEYIRTFEEMCRLYDSGRGEDMLLLESCFLRLIHNIIIKERNRSSFAGEAENRKGKMIEEALSYIENNLTSDLSLETVASSVGFSPIHFHNVFKTSVGKTLHRYVEEQRIKKSEFLLITTDGTLSEIAYECGFSSQSYFSFAFKRKTGMTPRDYVRSHYERYGMEG